MKFPIVKTPEWGKLQPTHLTVSNRSTNLGDDVQSISASRLWDCHDYVDRDRPETWTSEMLIPLCGWFGYGEFPTKATVSIIGFHCEDGSRRNLSQPRTRDWLACAIRDQGHPALCRDTATRDFLRSLGLEAEFAGCVTLQLGGYEGERSGVYAIDTHNASQAPATAIRESHAIGQRLDAVGMVRRLERANQQLDKIRQAEHLYTTRLHVWLPAVAAGTPCTMHSDVVRYQRRRLSGYCPDVSAPVA